MQLSMEQKRSSTRQQSTSQPFRTLVSDEDDKPPLADVPGGCVESSAEASGDDTEPPGRTNIITKTPPVSDHNLYLFISNIDGTAQSSSEKIVQTAKLVQPSPHSKAFLHTYFPDTGLSEWNDWHWQLGHRITCASELKRFITLSADEEAALSSHEGLLPLAITPYYLSILDRDDPEHPLRRTVIPVSAELVRSSCESEDPLSEEDNSPVPGLVHRYPDRVLLLATGFCSVYCRYCTRSRIFSGHGKGYVNACQWEQAIQYIRQNPCVRDVLISGGDPLTLENSQLEYLISEIRRIPHVEIIRLGTKVPVVLPHRITLPLTRMLKKYHPLLMSIHFTHPKELTNEAKEACNRLADAGIPLGSQTVLLKGINDNTETMKRLFHGLLKLRVKPYYLYQCDPIVGSAHFRTSVTKGVEIIASLQGHTSGYAVPRYVIDAPGGGGKIPVCSDTVIGREGEYIFLRNYEGRSFRYPDNSDENRNGVVL
jgi:lysine 2,3-aminomutase